MPLDPECQQRSGQPLLFVSNTQPTSYNAPQWRKTRCASVAMATPSSSGIANRSVNLRQAQQMNILKRRNRFYDTTRFGQPEIRVYHKRGKGKRMPRYLLKCGCCEKKLEIYYADDGLEIGGVNGSIADWRDILLPLLQMTNKPSASRQSAARR